MWFRAWPLLLLPLAAFADSKIVYREKVDRFEIVQAEYRQGRNMRWETGNQAQIVNASQRRLYILDLRKRTWLEQQRQTGALLVLASWIQRPPRVHESGKTVDVWYQTTDTGERREMFGRTARHLITHERRVAEAGACGQSSEVETDGWYVESPLARRNAAYLLASNYQCRDNIVTHGAPPCNGLPLLETTKGSKYTRTRQVLDFSEQPLDPALFGPPSDFRHVDSPETWGQRIESDWQQVELAFRSWLN
jgi:hypothetical protein